MVRRRQSYAQKKFKKFVVSVVIFLLMLLFPLMIAFMFVGGVVPSAAEGMIGDYKAAAEIPGCGWQELIALDTVRYENDFEDADPFASALEFMIVEYEIYEIEGKGEKVTKVLIESGTLNTAMDILNFFGLPLSATATDVSDKVKANDHPNYVINIHSKDIEDVINEQKFDEEQKEWIGMLLTDGLLSEMFGDSADLPDFIASEGKGYFAWPTPGSNRITSRFGSRWGTIHYGLDIGVPVGTPVIAIADGIVTGASTNGGTAGTFVKIRHEKDGQVWESKYFHLSEYKVAIGDKVKRGTVIAASGNTGNSTGPHLHIGIMLNGVYTDPEPLITE